MSVIRSYCQINNQTASVNGNVIYTADPASDVPFLKQLYHSMLLEYPKFHKMDRLAQAGFLGAELIRKCSPQINDLKDDQVAMVFANSLSSADTDRKFEDSYTHQSAPSPSLFVYTLPNIVMGEIAIRNKWFGENVFCVFSAPDYNFYLEYCQILFAKGAKAVLCGWVEVSNGLDIKMFLTMPPDQSNEGISLDLDQLKQIFIN